LEQSAAAGFPTWFPNSTAITDDGTNKSINIPATNTSRFFRLRRP
jgi:hypothetical protein